MASSEIYPTWPENALRANIYVIISFTLNRVYTEYYRVQGYNFDITSSTSYDQAFVEGRDIFDNISELVDELFTDYIVREGHVEPMCSSYCSGTTATCKGLSQWGSYYLASQGYTPYRILQYYYGSDINLIFNAPEGPALPSYPGWILRRGAADEYVRTLQKMLKRISQNFPAVPTANVNTGVFDGATEAAVRGFQRTFGMTVDGIVGRNTWNRVVSIFNSVRRLNELDSEGVNRSEASVLYATSLRRGDIGYDVRAVQFMLDFVGSFYESIGTLFSDGIFGSLTEAAVIEFQRIYNLVPDGIVGRNTIFRLTAVYSELYNTLSEEDAQYVYPNYALSQGDSGEKVRTLQTMLSVLAQRVPVLTPVVPDGLYGSATTNAVASFQRFALLPVSGDVGILTWNTIVNRYNLSFSEAPSLFEAEPQEAFTEPIYTVAA